MKKIVSIFVLVVLVFLLVSCGSNSTEDINTKYDELVVKYDELFNNYKDLYNKYLAEVEDDISIPVIIQSIANLIDEKSVVTIFGGKVVHIMVSYSTDIKEKVEEYYSMIPNALKKSGYETCIISVVDDTGKCVCGWTIYGTGENEPFLSSVR